MTGEEYILPSSHRKAFVESSLGKTSGLSIKEGNRGKLGGRSGSHCYINQRQGLGTQWGYSKMQGTDGPKPGTAVLGSKEKKRGELFLWVTVTGNLPTAV